MRERADSTCRHCGSDIDYAGGTHWVTATKGEERCPIGGEHEDVKGDYEAEES
jgi:hypothetical protein